MEKLIKFIVGFFLSISILMVLSGIILMLIGLYGGNANDGWLGVILAIIGPVIGATAVKIQIK